MIFIKCTKCGELNPTDRQCCSNIECGADLMLYGVTEDELGPLDISGEYDDILDLEDDISYDDMLELEYDISDDKGGYGNYGENIEWTLSSDGILTISGNGEVSPWFYPKNFVPREVRICDVTELYYGKPVYRDPPWDQYADKIRQVIIKDGVTSISGNIFNEKYVSLTSIMVPGSVKRIVTNEFKECKNLEKVVFANGTEEISPSAFFKCEKLSEVIIPESLSDISAFAFFGCPLLQDENGLIIFNRILVSCCSNDETVIVPDGVIKIGRKAFYKKKNLVRVVLPESVQEIGEEAFEFCKNLENINIPADIVKIGKEAFFGCLKLRNITASENLSELGDHSFHMECVRTDENGFVILGKFLYGYVGRKRKIQIPKTVKVIMKGVFKGCKKLEEVMIPESVEEIESYAFADCKKLKKVIIKGRVPWLSANLFENCVNLTDISLSDTITQIRTCAFKGCISLKKFVVPERTEDIYSDAFLGCSSLEELKMPDSVKNIYLGAFKGCDKLPVTEEISKRQLNRICLRL